MCWDDERDATRLVKGVADVFSENEVDLFWSTVIPDHTIILHVDHSRRDSLPELTRNNKIAD